MKFYSGVNKTIGTNPFLIQPRMSNFCFGIGISSIKKILSTICLFFLFFIFIFYIYFFIYFAFVLVVESEASSHLQCSPFGYRVIKWKRGFLHFSLYDCIAVKGTINLFGQFLNVNLHYQQKI